MRRVRTASDCRAASAVWPAPLLASITAPTTFLDWAKRSPYKPGSAVYDCYRTESEPAFGLPAEPTELLAVQHGLERELKLSPAPVLQALGHRLLFRPLFAGCRQQRLQAVF